MCEPAEDNPDDHIPFTQCLLVKPGAQQTSWIPSKFAKLGSIVKLKDNDNNWEDGWKVAFCGHTRSQGQLNYSDNALRKTVYKRSRQGM